MRDSIIFYRSFVESFSELSDEDRLTMYDAVFKYGLDGEEPELTGLKAALFKLVKPQLDANTRRYENGLKGGRKPNRNQSETKPNQTETKTKPNVTKQEPNLTKAEPNVNVNVNYNPNGNGNASGSDEISSLISFMNDELGSHYKDGEQVRDLIGTKLDEGYSVNDIKKVIRNKAAEWSCDGKMRNYLRPSTLFGSKFEEYLNAPEPIEVEEDKAKQNKAHQLKSKLSETEAELKQITDRVKEIELDGITGMNRDEYNSLRFDAAHLDDVIGNLKRRLSEVV